MRLLTGHHHSTRALVRNPSRAPHGDVDVVLGEFDRPDTLDAAMRDVDTVLLVSPGVPAGERAVIDSAVRHDVTHIVNITNNASADSPVERRRHQAQIEAHLEASGLAYTLLRANAFMQNLLALAPMIKQTQGFAQISGLIAEGDCAWSRSDSGGRGHGDDQPEDRCGDSEVAHR